MRKQTKDTSVFKQKKGNLSSAPKERAPISEQKANLLLRTGELLVVLALLLVLHNWWEGERAAKSSQQIIEEMQAALEANDSAASEHMGTDAQNAEEADRSLQMQEITVDGYAYIGYLSVPALKINLPVMSQWSDAGLKLAPCRHFGATATDDLVIAAHNYRRHFGALGTLKEGDEVTFTENDGYVNRYAVCKVVTLNATEVQYVTNNEYDLVLYTCTTGGQKRLAAFCKRIATVDKTVTAD